MFTARGDSVTDPDGVEAHLARLSVAACRAFVADLWAARGFETQVDGDVVIARRHGQSRRLFVAGGRFRGQAPSGPVDVVVSPSCRAGGVAVADEYDARLLTAADLREMLRYGVDPAVTDTLCERHLGAAPSALTLPVGARLRARLARFATADPSVGTTALVALLVIVVFGVTAAGVTDPSATSLAVPTSGASSAEERAVSPAPTSDTPADPDGDTAAGVDAAPDDGPETVPGVGADGVTNLTALAAAHDRALGNASYTLWLDSYRPENGVPGEPRTQRDIDIAVATDGYLIRESVEPDGDARRLVRAVYFDGADWYVNDNATDPAMIRWVDGSSDDASVEPDLQRLQETLITRYLATPDTTVTERSRRGGTTYRLEGAGRPPGFAADRVYNYSFVAVVDARGFVREAVVEYTVVTVEGSYRFRFEWTYGRLGATSITAPEWVERARPATERTATSTSTQASTSDRGTTTKTVP